MDREKLTKVMATATVVALEQRGMIHKRGFTGRGRGLGNVVRKNQCVYCREEGLWKNECPKLKGTSQTLIAEAGAN